MPTAAPRASFAKRVQGKTLPVLLLGALIYAPLSKQGPVAVIQSFSAGAASVRARNPDVKLRFEREGDEPALIVEYPPPSSDPAGRDVWCSVETRNWTEGRAITFRAKSAHPVRLSVSFLDRNHVAYTSWTDLPDTAWHAIRIVFDEVRPNPYFQPPDARTGSPIDVSDVDGIAFAPHDKEAGRLVIGRIELRE